MLRKGVLFFLLGLLVNLGACRSWERGSATPAVTPTIASTDVRTIAGRPFMLFVVVTPDPLDPPGATTQAGLCIKGDDRDISFGSSTGPATVAVVGNKIQFGGHTFEVTNTPGAYVVDGRAHTLPAGFMHIFWDGKFIATDAAGH